ncbi:MAG: alpha/beta hydrolase [Actinomycetota bacterium]|nr:alpha/beta hydrolase [Actinomycetota bacterium]
MLIRQEGRVTVEDDVVFGSGGGRDLKCDVFLPPQEGSARPAILLVHGGGWMQGDRSQLRGYGIQLARYGFVCVASEYRLSGEAVWPAQIHDVKAALRWMRANADRYGIDPARIAVSGNSAGAHLALMLAGLADGEMEGDGGNAGVATDVAAVVAIYPPTELRVTHPRDPIGLLLGGTVDRDVEDAASPLAYVHPGYPPTMLVHGNADEVVPVEASFAMYHALVSAGAPCDLHVFHGEPHAFDAAPAFGRQVADLIAQFVHRAVSA